MAFWAGILFAAIFAFIAVKKGFYEIWAGLFNLAVSIYLAIYLAPTLANLVPIIGNSLCTLTLCLLITAVAVFLLLHGITFVLFTGQFKTPFPKIIDIVGAGIWGFLGGFLLWSFIVLLASTTGILGTDIVKNFDVDEKSKQTNVSYLSFWCNVINKAAANEEHYLSAEQAIGNLFKIVEENQKLNSSTTTDPNKIQACDPNKPKTSK